MLISNLGLFFLDHFEYKESFGGNLGKNYRMIHLTWKFQIWVFERCSFLIWLLILIVLYIYFNWAKSFGTKSGQKARIFDSKSFKLNVEILKLLLIFIPPYYYSWHVFGFQSHCYFNDMYLLIMWSLKCQKYIIDWDF